MTKNPGHGPGAKAETANRALRLYGAAHTQVGRAFAAREGLRF